MKYYLIWATDKGQWWAPNQRGYRHSDSGAGRYTVEEVIEILKQDRLQEQVLVRECDLPFVESYVRKIPILPMVTK